MFLLLFLNSSRKADNKCLKWAILKYFPKQDGIQFVLSVKEIIGANFLWNAGRGIWYSAWYTYTHCPHTHTHTLSLTPGVLLSLKLGGVPSKCQLISHLGMSQAEPGELQHNW